MTNNTATTIAANLDNNLKGEKIMKNDTTITEFINLSWEKTHADYDKNASLNAKHKIYAYDSNGDLGILFTSNVNSKWCLNSEERDHRFDQADDGWTPEIIEVFENEAGDKYMTKDLLFKAQAVKDMLTGSHEFGTFYTRQYIRFDAMIGDGWSGGDVYEHLGIYYMEGEREKIHMSSQMRKNALRRIAA